MSQLPDHVGLDFGSHSVKAVQLEDISSNKPTLVNFGSQITPQGVINSEDASHQQKLTDALKALFDSAKIKEKRVVMALPEFSVFEAKRLIPLPIEEVQMSYLPIGYDDKRSVYKVLIVAAPRKIIDIYTSVVDKAGLEPVAIETESIAMGRAMYRSTGIKEILMLDFGAQSTDMSIMNNGFLVFAQSISIGSDALTQAIVNKFGFEYNQAEEYKRNYGLAEDVLEGKVAQALKPVMDSILVEIQRGMEFYKSRTLLPVPQECLLNGDGAMLPGLEKYMTAQLNINTKVGDPWTNIKVDAKYANALAKSKPSFSVAVGLALKTE